MRNLTLLPAFAALWACSSMVTPALAADATKPAAATKAATPPKTPVMTRDELRDCMAKQDSVRGQTDAITKTRSELDAQKAEIARQDAAMKDELATLDRTSADAVNGYNAKVLARDKLIDDYNARNPAYNASVEALQTERAAYAKACENRRFDEKDEIAIKKGK